MLTSNWRRSLHWLPIAMLMLAGCPAPPAPDSGGGDPNAPGGGSVSQPGTPGSGGVTEPGTTPDPAAPNNKPVASLVVSPGGGVHAGTMVTLDASASSDPDGDALTFSWQQMSGTAASMSASDGSKITIDTPYLDAAGSLRFQVTVADGRGGTATAEATVPIVVADQFAGHPQDLAPYRNNLTPDEAYHFLRRTSFGGTPGRVQEIANMGLAAAVNDVLFKRKVPGVVQRLADSYETDVHKRWLVHMIEGPNPLRERVALFWHDRFATSRRVLNFADRNLAVTHWEMLRRNALGNYRTFLEDLTLDPLMLIWLDGGNSPKDNPNENYAREFWELFTLGRDVLYTEADITESARAFTGITLLRESGQDARPVFDILNHDNTPKTIFPGRADPVNHDFHSVIDLTLAQPEAARYVARNLFVFFVHDHPSGAVVNELASDFINSGFEIEPLVRKIISSRAFFSREAHGNQVTSPVEHIVCVARTLDMHFYREDAQGYLFTLLANGLDLAGQRLLDPPGVEGWKEDRGWLEDQWILNRVEAIGRVLDMDFGIDRDPGLPYQLLPPRDTWDQREVRRQMVLAVANAFHLDLTEEEIDIYIEVLDLNGHLAFHLLRPDQQRPHVMEMIRLMAMDERVITQ